MFTPFRLFRKATHAGIITISALAIIGSAQAKTIRIAEHRQARIDALKQVVPEIEKKYDVQIEIVEYPAPEKDYLTKLLTELRSGNAPRRKPARPSFLEITAYSAPVRRLVQ